MIALYAGILFFFLYTYGGFRIGYLKKGNLLCSQILSIGLLNIITYIQISLLDKKFHDPRILLAMTLVQLLAAIVWTYLFQWLYRLLFPPRRMLLVCGDRPAFHLMEKINSREDKYYLAKAIHIRAGMEAIIREAGAFDALIIGDIPAKDRNALLKKCFEEDIRTYTVPKLSDILIRTSEELDIFDSPLLLSRNEGISGGQRFVKRAIDLFFSGLGIVVLSPFFLLVALSIYLTDRGPVFYKQTRLTEGGKEFQICKFRTMIQNAEAKTGARLAAENDDRILPVGHFLRRTRLDELPQLFKLHDFLISGEHKDGKIALAMAGFSLKNTLSENGAVTRGVCVADDTGHLEKIIETTGIQEIDGKIQCDNAEVEGWITPDTMVSMNMWAGYPDFLQYIKEGFPAFLEQLGEHPEKKEYLLPNIVAELLEKEATSVKVLSTSDKWIGITYKEDIEPAQESFSRMITAGCYPENLWI